MRTTGIALLTLIFAVACAPAHNDTEVKSQVHGANPPPADAPPVSSDSGLVRPAPDAGTPLGPSPAPAPSATPSATPKPSPTPRSAPHATENSPEHPTEHSAEHQAEHPAEHATPTPTPRAKPKPKPKPTAHAENLAPSSFFQDAVWPDDSQTEAWTTTTIAEIRKNLPQLEQAKDIDDFCPAYENAPARERLVCWLRLISSVTEYESSFDPTHTYREPAGEISVGLLQLTAGDCTYSDRPVSAQDLLDPNVNLECGIQVLARRIAQDDAIDGPFFARGASGYWSTLRAPYDFLSLHLGKKNLIVRDTQNYMEF